MNFVAQGAAIRAFDRLSGSYDQMFTSTAIGRAQRQQVWRIADRLFHPGMHILELNCGTGEDAMHFARRGIRVTALDASSQMIARANLRTRAADLPITFSKLPSEALRALRPSVFDGIFSNFSGLNCVSDLHQVAHAMSFLLRANACALLCFSTPFCLWETTWYLLQFDGKRATRRWGGRTTAKFDGENVEVFYPSLRELRKAFAPWFTIRNIHGVGIAVPPSYVNRYVEQWPRILGALSWMDSFLGEVPALRNWGDHILLSLERTTA